MLDLLQRQGNIFEQLGVVAQDAELLPHEMRLLALLNQDGLQEKVGGA